MTMCASRHVERYFLAVIRAVTDVQRDNIDCKKGAAERASCGQRATWPHPWMISRSATGSTLSSTCTTSGSSKALQTWKMPSTAAMLDKKALPRPSPSAAPLQGHDARQGTDSPLAIGGLPPQGGTASMPASQAHHALSQCAFCQCHFTCWMVAPGCHDT